ncbi:hypothetical protein R1flu_026456 [Riccia fluitans]|uniref:F-box domain-containing protein n=1 Tax=Riccia fluitans TaxID=41844 RepID=A0ABD1XG02_9MARC
MAASQQEEDCGRRWIRDAASSSSGPSQTSITSRSCDQPSSSFRCPTSAQQQQHQLCLCLSLLCRRRSSPRSTRELSAAAKEPVLITAGGRRSVKEDRNGASTSGTSSMDIEMKERSAGCGSLEGDWLSNVPGGKLKDGGGGEIISISRKRTRLNGWGVNCGTASTAVLIMQQQRDEEEQWQQQQRDAEEQWQQEQDEVCKLPDHLIESVLARLPLQSFFRFRAVCSSWNSYLYSSTFLKAYSEAGNRQCLWFLVVSANLGRSSRYGHRVVATYDPEYNNWHRIPLPAPLCELNPYPTAADGGLVCYFVYENRLRTLFVCNPLTKSLRKLPLVLKCSSHISVLKMAVVDRRTNSYFVFVAGMVPSENGGDSLSMEVYNSLTDSWTKCGIIPAKYPKRKPVFGNGVLYVRCYDQRSLLITYDMNLGVWNRICASLPHTLGYEELVYYRGHVYLVGVLEENYKIESVCMWELQNKLPYPGYVWKEVDRMPRALFMEIFCDRDYFECQEDERVLMKCCLYGDLILLVAFNISHRGPFKVLAYDLVQKTWRTLPSSFHANDCRTHKFIEGIIYEPRLDIMA